MSDYSMGTIEEDIEILNKSVKLMTDRLSEAYKARRQAKSSDDCMTCPSLMIKSSMKIKMLTPYREALCCAIDAAIDEKCRSQPIKPKKEKKKKKSQGRDSCSQDQQVPKAQPEGSECQYKMLFRVQTKQLRIRTAWLKAAGKNDEQIKQELEHLLFSYNTLMKVVMKGKKPTTEEKQDCQPLSAPRDIDRPDKEVTTTASNQPRRSIWKTLRTSMSNLHSKKNKSVDEPEGPVATVPTDELVWETKQKNGQVSKNEKVAFEPLQETQV